MELVKFIGTVWLEELKAIFSSISITNLKMKLIQIVIAKI